jgi:hypothetical protein
MAQIESWKNKHNDGFYTKTTQKGGFNKLCVKIQKRCYTVLPTLIFKKNSILTAFKNLTIEIKSSKQVQESFFGI